MIPSVKPCLPMAEGQVSCPCPDSSLFQTTRLMKPLLALLPFALVITAAPWLSAAPLRVLITGSNAALSGPYSAALKAGGAQVTTGEADESKLANADVVILHNDRFDPLPQGNQDAISAFAKRGGGIVALNGAVAAGSSEWGQSMLGGAWNQKDSRKFKDEMMLYVVSNSHPIVKDSSPFDLMEETYYDLDISEKAYVLASAFTLHGKDAKRGEGPRIPDRDARSSIFDIQAQMWTWEGASHRAFVLLQGAPETMAHASVRAFILRAVAWTGKRENVDEFCPKADLANLRYPAGGPLRAADSIKKFQMQPGFAASVVAEEPLINKPIAIQWDGRGRIWVAETPEYPNGKRTLNAPAWKETGVREPGVYDRPGRDSISMLQDTNGDGLMDKKHIFYTGLELVTGFCLSGDGVIAVAHPNIISLRDTDGDGVADTEKPLFGGFAPGDTHFVANHFVEAPDGWVYVSTGSGADATNPQTGKLMAKISPGVFRFKPDGSAIEQVASQGGNSFGGEVTSDMEIYHGKATSGNPVQHVVMPEWVLARASGVKADSLFSVNPGREVARKDLPVRANIRQIDQVGRYSAACSTAVYEGGAWPKEYNGMIFMTEPILDIIHCEKMTQDGAVMKGPEKIEAQSEWLQSTDYWFCPVDVSFGPDGAMYVLDFNTPVVTHNDTRGPQHSKSGASVRPDRDQYFGRIYRIQHQSAPKFPNPDLYNANAAALVAAFKHPSKVVRFNAIRILMEKADTLGKQAVAPLTSMAASEPSAPSRILALWALSRLGQLKDDTLSSAMKATDAGVRKNAYLIAESAGIPLNGAAASAGIGDKDDRVRLATLRALGASTMTSEASSVLLASNAKLNDPWSKAAAAAANTKAPTSQLEEVLTDASGAGQSEESVRSMAAALMSSGNQAQLPGVLKAAAGSTNAPFVIAVLQELAKSSSASRGVAGAIPSLRTLLASSNKRIAASALPLAAAWDKTGALSKESTKVAGELLNAARDPNVAETSRTEAVKVLLPARALSKFILPNVAALLAKPQPEALAKELITSLAATGEPTAGTAIVDAYPTLPENQHETAFNAVVSRPEWAKLFLDAVEAKKIAAASLAPARVSRLTSHPDSKIAERSKALFGGGAGAPGKDELVTKLLPEIEKPGNVANGKVLFSAMCATCHKIEGQGNVFGPNLDGIGAHPVRELLTHIVNPNLVVDDEHRTWNITMKDGTLHSALIASENEARVQIRMPAGVTLDLNTADIASREKGSNSLMPEGLEGIGTENLRDIIAYIRSVAPQNQEKH